MRSKGISLKANFGDLEGTKGNYWISVFKKKLLRERIFKQYIKGGLLMSTETNAAKSGRTRA